MAAEEPTSSPHHAPPDRPATRWTAAALEGGPRASSFEPIVDLRTVATVGFRASVRHSGAAASPAADGTLELPPDPTGVDAWLATTLVAASRLPPRAWLLVELPLARLHAGPLDIGASGHPIVILLSEPVRAADLAMLRTRTLDGHPRLALAIAAAATGPRGGEGEVTLGVLRPEFLVLDEDVVDGVHANPARRARLAEALDLTRRVGATPIAFGVRRAEDERQLAANGVTLVAGRRYGSPIPVGSRAFELGAPRPIAAPASAERATPLTPRDDDDVARAIGIGTALAGALRDAGIRTIGELRQLGGIEAWERVRRVRPSVASGATLLQLEGATRDQRLTQLPTADRARLRAEARARLAGEGPPVPRGGAGGPPEPRG